VVAFNRDCGVVNHFRSSPLNLSPSNRIGTSVDHLEAIPVAYGSWLKVDVLDAERAGPLRGPPAGWDEGPFFELREI
jgi:hypothetical protein